MPLSLESSLAIFAFSLFAGVLGSLVGIGGGILIVPFLTLGMGVNFHSAAGASIVSVIATSSGAGTAYLRDRLVTLAGVGQEASRERQSAVPDMGADGFTHRRLEQRIQVTATDALRGGDRTGRESRLEKR